MVSLPQEHPSTQALRVGERFMLRFDDPSLVGEPQIGRLQQLRKDGALCIDVPPALRPRRGTPVQVESLRRPEAECSFASEILGRGRLNGRLPVLLVKAPEAIHWEQRRAAYRISVALKARLEWQGPGDEVGSAVAVVTDLSGSGAQAFLRAAVPAEAARLRLSLAVPDSFVESTLRLRGLQPMVRGSRTPAVDQAWRRAAAELRARFDSIPARVIRGRHADRGDGRGFCGLALAFLAPHEEAYRLVRHLERQAAQKGLSPDRTRAVATAA
ncbi:MAG: hypothetical protein WDA75_17000 [Candidatus Latescibacterota bacterium]